jgi:hypothetical protein
VADALTGRDARSRSCGIPDGAQSWRSQPRLFVRDCRRLSMLTIAGLGRANAVGLRRPPASYRPTTRVVHAARAPVHENTHIGVPATRTVPWQAGDRRRSGYKQVPDGCVSCKASYHFSPRRFTWFEAHVSVVANRAVIA